MSKKNLYKYQEFIFCNKSIFDIKDELKQYFLDTYNMYEELFKILKSKNTMYQQPNRLRHPLIFYYGHTASFFINKMILSKMIDKRLNSYYEKLFAIGVDEMKWDDLNQSNYKYPSVDDLQIYRDEVKKCVLNVIDNLDISLPIKEDSDIWIILMAIEHENIHIETSSVLLRQLDISFVQSSDIFVEYNCKDSDNCPINELVDVKGKDILLGNNKNDICTYSWDNEFGTYTNTIKDFKVSKYLVSNKEFLEFVNNDGYKNEEYWSSEGLKWLQDTNATMPHFWRIVDSEYYQRELTREIKLPLNYPVETNYYEAEAFCRYKSKRDNISVRLPSEDEYIVIFENNCEEVDDINIGLKYSSTYPINIFKSKDIYDIRGNVWQWCSSPIFAYDGFETHFAYDDFSIPTYDDKHFMIKGGSFASRGNVANVYSRYAFRKNFFQHSGFRYVVSNNIVNDVKNNNIYESLELVEQYCNFHYGKSHFNVDNFMKYSVEVIAKIIKKYDINTNKAMDLGCSVGRASFELGCIFDEVVGIDFSANFIDVALRFYENKNMRFSIVKEGNIKEKVQVDFKDLGFDKLKANIEFAQGDACNLKDKYTNFDVIFCSNLIDRLYDPYVFIQEIQKRVNKDGLLVLLSPYTWLEEYTPKEKWLGGYIKDGKEVYTIDTLQNLLIDFELIYTEDIEFIIQETSHKYQHSISQMSVFKKLV
jgi:5-histidylcysteine sulfoxide synthase/putative 4-mercaptohistidine N1-methyltranferase